MKKLGVFLQPFTILLIVALLVLVIIDLYTYAWNTDDFGIFSANARLSYCTPWSIQGCSQLWDSMGIRHKVAIILHVCLIPLTIIMVLVSSLGVFTRAIRKQTAIIVLILISWITLGVLIATVILRISQPIYSDRCYEDGRITLFYHYHWQIYITLASLIIAFLITQIFAFGGYIRPMITMLSFEGHYQRYDYPRVSKLEKNMVSVKELDNF